MPNSHKIALFFSDSAPEVPPTFRSKELMLGIRSPQHILKASVFAGTIRHLDLG